MIHPLHSPELLQTRCPATPVKTLSALGTKHKNFSGSSQGTAGCSLVFSRGFGDSLESLYLGELLSVSTYLHTSVSLVRLDQLMLTHAREGRRKKPKTTLTFLRRVKAQKKYRNRSAFAGHPVVSGRRSLPLVVGRLKVCHMYCKGRKTLKIRKIIHFSAKRYSSFKIKTKNCIKKYNIVC